MTTPPQAGERAEASALNRAREYLRGIDTDGYRYDHPITILAALVAEIDAAPVGWVCGADMGAATQTTKLDEWRGSVRVGKSQRVRLLALGSGGAGEVANNFNRNEEKGDG